MKKNEIKISDDNLVWYINKNWYPQSGYVREIDEKNNMVKIDGNGNGSTWLDFSQIFESERDSICKTIEHIEEERDKFSSTIISLAESYSRMIDKKDKLLMLKDKYYSEDGMIILDSNEEFENVVDSDQNW